MVQVEEFRRRDFPYAVMFSYFYSRQILVNEHKVIYYINFNRIVQSVKKSQRKNSNPGFENEISRSKQPIVRQLSNPTRIWRTN